MYIQAISTPKGKDGQELKSFKDLYTIDPRVLGEGSFGRVQKCKRNSNEEYFIVKTIDKLQMEEEDRDQLKGRITKAMSLKHANLV